MARNTDEVVVTLKRSEAAALERIASFGLKAAEAFNLIDNTATAERALNALRAAVR